ncbi:MSC_0623 family F1-like ATPase-associated protein [Mycoplasma sp. 394]
MKNKTILVETPELLEVYNSYNQLVSESKFVSYKQFFASVLLKLNSSFNSKEFENFEEQVKKAFKNKYDLLFQKFVITFNLNPKFSLNKLVPMLAKYESSNNQAISFKTQSFDLVVNPDENIDELNLEIAKYQKVDGEVYLTENPNQNEDKFEILLNEINLSLLRLLLGGYVVEILPNIVLFISKYTNALKLFFNNNILKEE